MGSCFSFELSQLGKTALTFDESPHGDFAFTGDHGVGFPMAELLALVDGLGPFVDGNTAWNMVFGVLTAVAERETLPVVSNEVRDQISGLNVNPLVDGFGANGLLGM